MEGHTTSIYATQESHVAVFAPIGAPGVADDPELFFVKSISAIADNNHRVIGFTLQTVGIVENSWPVES